MTTERRADSPGRRLALGVIVTAVAAAGLTGVVTSALFTDTDTITGNTFTTGTVSLTTSPATAAITMTGMAPGDKVTRAITVTNAGTMALRYAVLSTTDAPDADFLAAQLDFTIKSGVTTCDDTGFDVGGSTVVYATGDLGSTTGAKVVGDSAAGAQAGDRVLAAAGSEVLCAQVLVPLGTGNTYQGKTTTATLTFNAEQTVNNP